MSENWTNKSVQDYYPLQTWTLSKPYDTAHYAINPVWIVTTLYIKKRSTYVLQYIQKKMFFYFWELYVHNHHIV